MLTHERRQGQLDPHPSPQLKLLAALMTAQINLHQNFTTQAMHSFSARFQVICAANGSHTHSFVVCLIGQRRRV